MSDIETSTVGGVLLFLQKDGDSSTSVEASEAVRIAKLINKGLFEDIVGDEEERAVVVSALNAMTVKTRSSVLEALARGKHLPITREGEK